MQKFICIFAYSFQINKLLTFAVLFHCSEILISLQKFPIKKIFDFILRQGKNSGKKKLFITKRQTFTAVFSSHYEAREEGKGTARTAANLREPNPSLPHLFLSIPSVIFTLPPPFLFLSFFFCSLLPSFSVPLSVLLLSSSAFKH